MQGKGNSWGNIVPALISRLMTVIYRNTLAELCKVPGHFDTLELLVAQKGETHFHDKIISLTLAVQDQVGQMTKTSTCVWPCNVISPIINPQNNTNAVCASKDFVNIRGTFQTSPSSKNVKVKNYVRSKLFIKKELSMTKRILKIRIN